MWNVLFYEITMSGFTPMLHRHKKIRLARTTLVSRKRRRREKKVTGLAHFNRLSTIKKTDKKNI